MKLFALIIAVLLLAGCASTQQPQIVVQTKYVVVKPAEEMYYCPFDKKLPNWKTLMDSQVAKTVVKLYKNNRTCWKSSRSVRQFIEDADKRLKRGG